MGSRSARVTRLGSGFKRLSGPLSRTLVGSRTLAGKLLALLLDFPLEEPQHRRSVRARIAFVIEQALGHVAYGMGLKEALADRHDIEGVWIEVPYALGSFGRVPYVGPNWTLRGSARAWKCIREAERERPLDALFLHTQTVSLFAGAHMGRIPTLLSLDATPKNLDEIGGSYAH